MSNTASTLESLKAAHTAHVRAELESLTPDERAAHADIDGNMSHLPAKKAAHADVFVEAFSYTASAIEAIAQWAERAEAGDATVAILRRCAAELAVAEAKQV